MGIGKSDVSDKINIVSFLYSINGKSRLDNGKVFPLMESDHFGKNHALELTKLHHEKIVIEERWENGKDIKLGIDDVFNEIDNGKVKEKKYNEVLEDCENRQTELLELILESKMSVAQVKKRVDNHIEEIKENVKDFRDEQRNKKVWVENEKGELYQVVYGKSNTLIGNDVDSSLDTAYDPETKKFKEVHLIVTSPPYFVKKEYEKENKTFDDHLLMMESSFNSVIKHLVPGGKVAVVVNDIAAFGGWYNEGGIPEEKVIIHHIDDMMKKNGCRLFARIIWSKDNPWANSKHVGYYSNPRHTEYRVLPSWEYVFVYKKDGKRDLGQKIYDQSTLKEKEWKEYVMGVWDIRSVASNKEHPAQFPDELVERLIKMYSFVGDNVLDPFLGSGTTVKVARELGRNGFGYEINEEYKDVIRKKLS